ncbi:protein lethal(2)essential for life-like [Agrilus planipennis]|uniref:Protein lethal(2)essential for life-like n=1 Tax=Agrilus planipennis TaxID=224129 RepID=A0A1W4WL58_AGRPL|nr:protein lethal(2)essential for life-like [Agrilus planipennis]
MPALLPYYFVPQSSLGQHFGLELGSRNVLERNLFNLIRCPAGYLRHWQNVASQDDSGSNLIHNGNYLRVQLDVQQFQPNEINVKVENRVLIVEGQHNEKEDGQGYVSRHFIRKYDIPENSDTNRIECTLSTDGILLIEMPDRIEHERVIPIQFGIPQADAA